MITIEIRIGKREGDKKSRDQPVRTALMAGAAAVLWSLLPGGRTVDAAIVEPSSGCRLEASQAVATEQLHEALSLALHTNTMPSWYDASTQVQPSAEDIVASTTEGPSTPPVAPLDSTLDRGVVADDVRTNRSSAAAVDPFAPEVAVQAAVINNRGTQASAESQAQAVALRVDAGAAPVVAVLEDAEPVQPGVGYDALTGELKATDERPTSSEEQTTSAQVADRQERPVMAAPASPVAIAEVVSQDVVGDSPIDSTVSANDSAHQLGDGVTAAVVTNAMSLPPKGVAMAVQQAREHLAREQASDAVAVLNEYRVQLDQNGLHLLATAQLLAGQPGESLQIYRSLLWQFPEDDRAWLGAALSLEALNDWQAAELAWRQVAQRAQNSALKNFANERVMALAR